MNHLKIIVFLLSLFCLSIVVDAQTIATDTIPQRKLPVQAFAAMPVLFGVHVEHAFSYDKHYTTFAENELTLPIEGGQNYSLFGSLPIIRKRKGFSAKINFNYNIFKDHIGTATFQDRTLLADASARATSAYAAFNISQNIPFKKWNKKLIVSGTFAASGKQYTELKSYRGLAYAMMPLKMTPNAMFTVGVLGIIGKNVQRPILPILAYFTRLGPALNLEMILPVSTQLRYVVSNKASYIVGAKLGSRTPYVDSDLPILQGTDDVLEFKSKNLRLFATIERALGDLVWFNAEVGYNRATKNILNTPNQDLRNKLFIGDGFGYTYVQVGLFLRPVFRFKNRQ